MQPFIVACLLVASAGARPGPVEAQWSAFKAEYGKSYGAHEEQHHRNNYLQAAIAIDEHNARFRAGQVGYSLGLNAYSDLSPSEFRSRMLGQEPLAMRYRNFTKVATAALSSVPQSLDWRQKGIVSPVKDQQYCGSCYAFGTLAVIESAIAQSTGKIVDLSEQQVVDCSYEYSGTMNRGCHGGYADIVAQFVAERGLVAEESYVYTSGLSGTHNHCRRSTGTYGKNLKVTVVEPNDEHQLLRAVAQHGPLVIYISAGDSDFGWYSGGIYDNPRCSKKIDHVVSVVGYGSENGKDFWIIKNSWGTSWGENGFARIRRGVNMCSVVSEESYSIAV